MLENDTAFGIKANGTTVSTHGGLMKSDKAAFFPLGLAFGTALGALWGNVGLGALLGMLTGLVIASSGAQRSR